MLFQKDVLLHTTRIVVLGILSTEPLLGWGPCVHVKFEKGSIFKALWR